MTDEIGGAEPLLNRAQLAQIFNVSENTIDKWRSKGMPVEVEGGNGVAYGFKASACREWYDAERAASERAKKEAAERRGSLIHADEVVELLDTIFGEMRAGLDGLPDWLEREFGLTGDQVERAVAYSDEVLRAVQGKIHAAALSEAPEPDPLDGGLI